MKTQNIYINIFLAVLISAVVMSCAGTDADGGASLKPQMVFMSHVEGMSVKATVDNSWDGGEVVKISIGDSPPVDYTVSADGRLIPRTMLYWDSPDLPVHVRAWYPDAFSMKSDQRLKEDYLSLDFIYASETVSFAESHIKPLLFRHKMSKVVVNLIKGDELVDLNNAEVIFKGYGAAVTDFPGGITAGSGDNVDILPYKHPDSYRYSALVVPQDMTAKPFIKVFYDGSTNVYWPEEGDAELTAGKIHIYNITVNSGPINVKSIRSTDAEWGDGDGYGVEGEV